MQTMFNLIDITGAKFGKVRLQPACEQLHFIIDQPMRHKTITLVTWKKSPLEWYKFDSDGSCPKMVFVVQVEL